MSLTTQNEVLPESGQAGVNPQSSRNFSFFPNDVESFGCGGMQPLEGVQDTLTLKGLSIAEAYDKGVLWIALQYRTAVTKFEEFDTLALISNHRDALNSASCFRSGGIHKIEPIDVYRRRGGDEHEMLVGDVQSMKPIKAKPPAFIGLYVVNDRRDDNIARRQSLCFMSIDGTFKRLPVFPERETPPFAKCRGVRIGGDMVGMIQGGVEIVNRIAKHGRDMLWESPGADLFQRVAIALSPHSIHVISDVVPKQGFELVDVMFGPFDF